MVSVYHSGCGNFRNYMITDTWKLMTKIKNALKLSCRLRWSECTRKCGALTPPEALKATATKNKTSGQEQNACHKLNQWKQNFVLQIPIHSVSWHQGHPCHSHSLNLFLQYFVRLFVFSFFYCCYCCFAFILCVFYTMYFGSHSFPGPFAFALCPCILHPK